MFSGRGVPKVLRLATRASPLALAQARIVEALIAERNGGAVATELVVVDTAGDLRQSVPLHEVGGQGIFVKEVERAVLDGRADAAVHSAKDLPASAPVLPIAAVPPRADPRDALVGRSLAELKAGAPVATGSVRRRAQLAWLRPDLVCRELRGNIATRLSKVPSGGAVVVAMAALVRLGREEAAADVLSTTAMLPQVGQGSIAVCARPGDEATAELLARLDHAPSRSALEAERAYLAAVGGGCELPVGAYAILVPNGGETADGAPGPAPAPLWADGAPPPGPPGPLRLDGLIASLDGHVLIRESLVGNDPVRLGRELAARVLDASGGRSLLERAGMRAP